MKTFFATAAVLLATTSAYAQSSPQNFVALATSGGLYEIRSSEMILDADGIDPKVQEFAQQMIADHTKAAEELAAAAAKAGVDVPTEPQPKEAKKLEQLAAAEDMQAAYLTQQNLAHNDAVVLHRSYAAGGTDSNLKAYAETVVPNLEEHDGHIEMLHGELTQ